MSDMYRFFAEPEQIGPDYVEILGADVNHMKNVLRMRPGEQVSVSDGEGREYLCCVDSFSPETARLRILEKQATAAELRSPVVFYQGLPKGDKMELIIQKAVELGASRIVPVNMKRCIVKWDAKKAEAKRRRWQEIARSAAKQSRRGVVPEVEPILSFPEAIAQASALDVKLLPYEHAGNMGETREILSSVRAGQSIGVFIGPEGGFDEAEVQSAMEAGLRPITLGRRILRTETAGLCILSVLMFRLEE